MINKKGENKIQKEMVKKNRNSERDGISIQLKSQKFKNWKLRKKGEDLKSAKFWNIKEKKQKLEEQDLKTRRDLNNKNQTKKIKRFKNEQTWKS